MTPTLIDREAQREIIDLLGKMSLIEYALECVIVGDIGPATATPSARRTFAETLRATAGRLCEFADTIDPLTDRIAESGEVIEIEHLPLDGEGDIEAVETALDALRERIGFSENTVHYLSDTCANALLERIRHGRVCAERVAHILQAARAAITETTATH